MLNGSGQKLIFKKSSVCILGSPSPAGRQELILEMEDVRGVR